MDILKTFTIGNDTTEINVQGTNERPLFQANQVGKALGIVNIHTTLKNLPGKHKVLRLAYTPGGPQELVFLTEGGLYRCIMKSKKDVAEAFQDWVADIVTELRAHGTYSLTTQISVLENQNKLDMKMASLQADRMRHDFLKNSMVYAKESLVYLGKIKELDDGRTIYKFGETGDIQVRGNGLRFEHAELGELVLVDVWPCHRCKDFENFILKHPLVSPHRCHEQVRGRNARELLYISSAFTMEQLRAIVLANIEDFQGFTREQVLEDKRLRLLDKMMDAVKDPNLSNEIKLEITKTFNLLHLSRNVSPVQAGIDGSEATSSSTVEENHNPDNEADQNPYIPRLTDPCVQKYNADLELVEVYETIREAARQNLNAKTFDISSAISNNTIYLGCRWISVARENKDVSQTLQPTQASNKRVRDRVAKIDPATGKIVRVFPDGVAAAINLAMGKTAVTTAIAKNDGHLEGFVWKFWSTCSAEEQASYEGDIADVAIVTSAKRVRQLDPNTGAVVKTWTNMQELVQAFKTCHKTINKKSAEASVYKGFRWQVTD